MDAGDLQGGFRLGEWLVEPRDGRIAGQGRSHTLPRHQMQILVCLAEHHGEAVDRRTLCERAWPGQRATDEMLRESIGALREIFGESRHDTRCIVSVARRGYALIAHFEPLPAPTASPLAAPPPGIALPSLAVRAQALVAELRRRSVFKVAGAYLLIMWIVLQVAETTFEPLRFPEWWMTALTILAVLGLPIVAVLAWSYEITPGGIVLDAGLPQSVRLPRARRAVAPVVVAGVSMMAAVTGYAWWRTINAPGPAASETRRFDPSPQSIAVLPLVDMSPSGESVYLGDGLSEELSSDLAKLPGLRVAARTSAFAYRGMEVDVRTIGEKLGVRYVLEGSVRREGDRVRVTAQLIDAVTGFHAWTESYDRPWQDLITIQQEISGAIAKQLQMVLTPEMALQLKDARTTDPRAYDFYLAGLAQLRKGGSISSIAEAEGLFHRSLAVDPRFARAQAGLCQVAITRYERTNASDHMHAAEAACRAALEADATLKETEHALGKLYLASGRREQAEAVFRSLLSRAPRDADVHIGLGKALAAQNRAKEAEQSFREAIIVEPGYWMAYNSLGVFLFDYGRGREAAEAFARVTELAPGNPSGFNNLGAALMASGELAASARASERSMKLEPSRSAYSNLGTVYYHMGRLDEAVAMFTQALELAPEDFQLWGGRADSLWFIAQGRDKAREDYRRATELAEKALAVNAADADTWTLLGCYYGRLGDAERSARYVKRGIELAPDSPFVNYYAAVSAADQGNEPEADRLIGRAVELGYSKVLASSDPALKKTPID